MDYLQKELYDRIKHEDAIFDFLQSSSVDGLWYWDLEHPENEWMSPKFWTTLGYDPDLMPHKAAAWQTIVFKEDLEMAMANFHAHVADPAHPYDQVLRFLHQNGSTVWIRCRGQVLSDTAGKPARMLGSHSNVTREKENEERLSFQNALLQSSFESHREILLFSIDREYLFLMFNSAFAESTFQAYGAQVKIGASMLETISTAEDREKVKHHCDLAFTGQSHVNIEIYGDLERDYFETRYNPIQNDLGEVIGLTIMSTNITDRKRKEEQLHELNKEMESFSYSASHDLRTPLRSIRGYTEILLEDFGDELPAEARTVVESIRRNVANMGNLIDDLLRYSRLGRSDLFITRADANELVRLALYDVYEEEKYPGLELSVQELLPARGDNTLLRQVWVNLLGNALKYTSRNAAPTVEIGCTEDEVGVTYFVKDNGVGFDMRYYEKIFGVFQRLHSTDEFEGNGVGLAIAQRILERLGGTIWAESELGAGATFFFKLPKFQFEHEN
jgi:PAS domain S-box-containing protein